MAGPPSTLRQLGLGKEVSFGTGVTATAKLMGLTNVTWQALDQTQALPELARLGPGPNVVNSMQAGAATVDAILTYEDICYFWDSLFGAATPSGGNPYVRSYSPPISAISVPRINTLEVGVPTTAPYRVDGGVLQKLNIKMANADYWRATGTFLGMKGESHAMAALSDRTVNVIRTADTQAWFDAATTVGSTLVSATVISAELDVDTKRHTKQYLGSINPGDFGEDKWTGTLKTSLEFNATAKAFVDALLSASPVTRIIQLRANSGNLVSTIDFAGYIDQGVQLWNDRNGNMIVDLTWAGYYATVLANWMTASVTNGVAALA